MSADKKQELPEEKAGAAGGFPADTAPGETDCAPEESEEFALAKIQSDLERFKDLAHRSQADLENFRKRAARDKEESVRYANQKLLEGLIPVIDSFELGLGAARAEGGNSPILVGMEMVAKQLADFLADQGVQAIDAAGQPFDPNIHEAIASEESADVPEGHVARQIRKGYKLRDRVLRAANVIVSKGKPA